MVLVVTQACKAKHPFRAELCWRQCTTRAEKSRKTRTWGVKCGNLIVTTRLLYADGLMEYSRDKCLVCDVIETETRQLRRTLQESETALFETKAAITQLQKKIEKLCDEDASDEDIEEKDQQLSKAASSCIAIKLGRLHGQQEVKQIARKVEYYSTSKVVTRAVKDLMKPGRIDLYYYGSRDLEDELEADLPAPRHFPRLDPKVVHS